MPLSKYDQFFGGQPGSAAKAHAAMGDQMFYAKVNMMKKKKAYGKAAQEVKQYTEALQDAPPEIRSAAALLEELYLRGFAAVQDGELSYEAVTAAVQRCVTMHGQAAAQAAAATAGGPTEYKNCVLVATFPGSGVYEEGGKFYAFSYRLMGTEAEIDGEPEEVTAGFTPMTAQPLAEGRESLLIEARPSGVIKADQINRALNVIEGTVLITTHSSNGGKDGRRYSEQALRKIADMAEGLPAYINHVAPELAFKARDARDLIGVHRNARYLPNEGKVVTDLHVAPHQAPLVFGLAETLGGHIGNSLVSRGAVQMEGNTEVVVDVLAVRSADIVSDPATTRGLFEARTVPGANSPEPSQDLLATIVMELRESLLKSPLKEEQNMDLVAILAHLKANPNDQTVLAENLGFVPKPTAAKLQEQLSTLTGEKDALAQKVTSLETEKTKLGADLQEAKVSLDGYKAKDALTTKRAKIVAAIEAHDLGKQFGKIKDVISADFKELMEGMDEDKWSKYLDNHLKSLKAVPAAAGVPPRSGLKADDLMEGEDGRPAPLSDPHARLVAAISR